MAEQKKPQSVTLRSPDGARLKCYVKVHKKTGLISTGLEHITAPNGTDKRVHTKGATSQQPTLEKAIAQQHALIESAVARGWVRPQPTLAAKADGFDAGHIPMPAKAGAPSSKK